VGSNPTAFRPNHPPHVPLLGSGSLPTIHASTRRQRAGFFGVAVIQGLLRLIRNTGGNTPTNAPSLRRLGAVEVTGTLVGAVVGVHLVLGLQSVLRAVERHRLICQAEAIYGCTCRAPA
jgi:hypothetical protein